MLTVKTNEELCRETIDELYFTTFATDRERASDFSKETCKMFYDTLTRDDYNQIEYKIAAMLKRYNLREYKYLQDCLDTARQFWLLSKIIGISNLKYIDSKTPYQYSDDIRSHYDRS